MDKSKRTHINVRQRTERGNYGEKNFILAAEKETIREEKMWSMLPKL